MGRYNSRLEVQLRGRIRLLMRVYACIYSFQACTHTLVRLHNLNYYDLHQNLL